MGAPRIPGGAGTNQDQGRAEYLDEDGLGRRQVGVDHGHAQRRRRTWVAVVHQVHRRHYLYFFFGILGVNDFIVLNEKFEL